MSAIDKQGQKEFFNEEVASGQRNFVVGFYQLLSGCHFFEENIYSQGRGKHVLDYGCGKGNFAHNLAKGAVKVNGIDISDQNIALATQNAQNQGLTNIDFKVMDAENLEFEDNTFDMVAGAAIIHHLDTERALTEITRVLRPGGIAIFLEPLAYNPAINLFRTLTPHLRTPDEHPLRAKDLKLIRLYFEKVDYHYFHLFSLLALPFRRMPFFEAMQRGLDAFDRLLFRLLPISSLLGWIVVMILRNPVKE